MRFGLAVQSVPARLAPEALAARARPLTSRTARTARRFREYVLRHKVESFRALTHDFAKPAELFPEIYQDWGDDDRVFAAARPRRVRQLGQASFQAHTSQNLSVCNPAPISGTSRAAG